ncbi:cytochrome b5 domain-containing protein RLF [Selaginella moellendorffii]|uniref:cytochrome b5 domain-containing protein RLF n=1 Tax=Selaginella moellendorffii TaxID=88036 RepID=UPI000D1C3BBD|nr:cytochrome b5 domain-containing protein RLF [Selaginella moellendorffii]|eukprot:XP_024523361.1 cytochrome b5 domain-containing protein RLF [Selaginella moellendorffii]
MEAPASSDSATEFSFFQQALHLQEKAPEPEPTIDNTESSKAMPPPKQRNKVPFEKGFSQMDWLKLTQSHPDLAGWPCSSALLHVYTTTSLRRAQGAIQQENDSYGGSKATQEARRCMDSSTRSGLDMLMKAAGKDCTSLFSKLICFLGPVLKALFAPDKYHAWVNAEFLLERCLLGALEQ